MALNVQTAGDEAIYVKFPGASGIPTPASGRTVANLVSGMLECRKIYRGDVTKVVDGQVKIDGTKATDDKILWVHKWRLSLSGNNCTFNMSSNDVKFTRSGNVGRCKNGKTITVTCVPSDGYEFQSWWDGNTNPTRTFTMDSHISRNCTCKVSTVTVRFFQYYGAPSPLSTLTINKGSVPTAPTTSIRGWTFRSWGDSYGQPVYEDTDYYGGWYMDLCTKEFNVQASDDPTSSTSSIVYNDELTPFRTLKRASYAAKYNGRTTIVFNNEDVVHSGSNYVGYDIPVNCSMTIDLTRAVIKHTASPVNHYIKLTCAILPNFADSLSSASYSKIVNAYNDSEEAGEWEAVTAPREADAGGTDTFEISAGACRLNDVASENANGYIAVRAAKLTKKEAEEEDDIEGASSCSVSWKVNMYIHCAI